MKKDSILKKEDINKIRKMLKNSKTKKVYMEEFIEVVFKDQIESIREASHAVCEIGDVRWSRFMKQFSKDIKPKRKDLLQICIKEIPPISKVTLGRLHEILHELYVDVANVCILQIKESMNTSLGIGDKRFSKMCIYINENRNKSA